MNYVFILGASGNVGRELVRQITEHDPSSTLVGVANSSKFQFQPEGIDPTLMKSISTSREKAAEIFSDFEGYDDLGDLVEVAKESELEGHVTFVDVTAGKEPLLAFHKKVLTDSKNKLVTANKNPISLFGMEDFLVLNEHQARYDSNTSVMAGAGAVSFAIQRFSLSDHAKKIEGCFSGTLGYILSELEKQEKPFSTIVREAKEAGYTEPNPWDDLNGLDVARKLLILARYSGFNVEMNDLKVEPMIPERFADLEGDAFLHALESENERFSEMIQRAKESGEVVRYVAEMSLEGENLVLSIGLKNCSQKSDFGALTGTANLVRIETDFCAEPIPHVIKSRGAGLEVTAASVRAGILTMNNK